MLGGLRILYVEHGNPSCVPVVFLHGYSDSWRSWELLLPKLPASVHEFALTQRGHGDADRPAAGYRPQDHAADVAAFMDAVGLDAAVIAGHSGGSYSAQRFALNHPQRTLGVLLVGAFRAFHDNPDVLELGKAISELSDPVDHEFVRRFQESTVAPPIPARFIETFCASQARTNAGAAR